MKVFFKYLDKMCNYFLCMLSCPVGSNSCSPKDCSPPGSSGHGIILTRILEWVAISSSRGSSQSRDLTQISCGSGIGKWILHQERVLECADICSSHEMCFFKININVPIGIFSFKCQQIAFNLKYFLQKVLWKCISSF